MANFSSTNFLETYNSTDLAIVFKNNAGKRVKGINVCKYLNSGVKEKELWIQIEGEKSIVLDFASEFDAKTAANLLATAVNTLATNCTVSPTFTGTVPKITTTLAQYKSDALASSLTEGAIYEITDTAGVIDSAGKVYSTLVVDKGQIIGALYDKVNREMLTANLENFTTSDRTDFVKRTEEGLGAKIEADPNSSYISARLDSYVEVANSQHIEATDSNIKGSNLQNIRTWRSTIDNANTVQNAIFEGITADLSSFPPGSLNNIKVSAFGDTLGKNGIISGATTNAIYRAYQDPREIIAPSSISTNISYTLDNPFPDAYAEFRVIVPDVSFAGNKITIKDKLGNIIDTVGAEHSGRTLLYVYNPNNGLFEKRDFSAPRATKVTIPVTTDGQTVFTDVLSFAPSDPTVSILTVGGHVAEYGASKDYHIVGRTLIWTNNSYELYTTDEVIITLF
jgi:hypothetical protein